MFTSERIINNISVIDIDPAPHLSALGLWLPRGSLIEKANENGWMHLLEHLSFRRTVNGSHNKFLYKLENLGMIYSAHTTQEYTGFVARFPCDKFEVCLRTLLDIAFSMIEVDLPTIQKEIAIRNREDEMALGGIVLAQDLSIDLLLGGKYLRPQGTTVVDGNNLSRFMRFHESNFHLGGGVVIFSHNDVSRARNMVREVLKDHQNKGMKVTRATLQPKISVRNEPTHIPSTGKNEYVSVALPFPGRSDGDHDLANLFCRFIGVGVASRLYQRIVVKDAQAYTVSLQHMVFEKIGVLALAASSSKNRTGFTEYFTGAVNEEFRKIIDHGLTEEEIQGAKEHYLSYTHALSENKVKFMMAVAERCFSNKSILDPRVAAQELEKLDSKKFKVFSNKYLNNHRRITAILAPKK
ncbi:MAG: insulinase family protein [Anaerolineaceae bacterium]|nr:insulinase family protein [Anaerolineaceae bacterium]MBN2676918.1 insulinase family protein [Anaerolineaceae bacterium]